MDKNKLIIAVLTIQFIFIMTILSVKYGLKIPSFIQNIYPIVLTLIPGYLFIKIINVNDLDPIETALYSVGISIFFIMVIGLLMNILYPLIGIKNPISTLPIISTFTALFLVLCSLLYLKADDKKKYLEYDFKYILSHLTSSKFLFLLSIPILSILGGIVNFFYETNVVLIFLLFYIVVTLLLIGFDKIPKKFYPMAILAISIALVLHTSLSTFGYLSGADIWHEYITQVAVVNNNIWNIGYATQVNSVISITILGPIYYFVTNLSLDWILKVIYPLIFSLVPLVLFKAYKRFTTDKISFFAVFLFMSLPLFYGEMLQLGRQEIAEFFLALLILLFSSESRNYKNVTLVVLFSIALIVSHYSLSYIYAFYIISSIILIYILRGYGVKFSSKWTKNSAYEYKRMRFLNLNYALLVMVICSAWYYYVVGGHVFDIVAKIGSHIIYSMNTEILSPDSRSIQVLQAVGVVPLRSSELTWQFARIFQILIQVFIVIGIFKLIIDLKMKKTIFNEEFSSTALTSMVILILCMILPYFANTINMGRFFQITLFFLAPFSILGGLFLLKSLNTLFSRYVRSCKYGNVGPKLLIIFVLIPYFLLSTGLIFEVTGSTPSSPALSLYRGDWSFFKPSEYSAGKWASEHVQTGRIYTDLWGKGMLVYNGLATSMYDFPPKMDLQDNSYIFLRKWNLEHNELYLATAGPANNMVDHVSISGKVLQNFESSNKIYDSGTANILFYEYLKES